MKKKNKEKKIAYIEERERKEEEHKKKKINKYLYTGCFKIHGRNFRDVLFRYAKIKFKNL